MAFLREGILEPVILDDDFTWRVARRSRLVQQRDSIRYWSPAFLGAGVACLVLLAALQLAGQANPANPAAGTAHRKVDHGFQASRTSVSDLDSSKDGTAENPFGSLQMGDGPLLLPKDQASNPNEP